jgi:hypothetical protein
MQGRAGRFFVVQQTWEWTEALEAVAPGWIVGRKAGATRLGWYLSLRSVDLATRLLPIGCFLGVLACEIAHTWSHGRLIVWNSGRSPLQCLDPAFMLSAFAGAIQFGLDTYLRPAAVMAQVAEHLGEYGERFDRRPLEYQTWITAGNDLVHAQIEFGPPPALRNVMTLPAPCRWPAVRGHRRASGKTGLGQRPVACAGWQPMEYSRRRATPERRSDSARKFTKST